MLNITQAVTRSVRGTFNYKGRSRRSEYWWTFFFFATLLVTIGLVEETISPAVTKSDMEVYFVSGGWKTWLLEWKYYPVSMLFYYISLPTLFALEARRMHDVGRAAWIGLLPYITLELLDFIQGPSYFDWIQGSPPLTPVNIVYLILVLVSLFGLYALALSLMDSKKTANKYGPSPKYSGYNTERE